MLCKCKFLTIVIFIWPLFWSPHCLGHESSKLPQGSPSTGGGQPNSQCLVNHPLPCSPASQPWAEESMQLSPCHQNMDLAFYYF